MTIGIYKTKDMMRIFNCSRQHIFNMARDGRIPPRNQLYGGWLRSEIDPLLSPEEPAA